MKFEDWEGDDAPSASPSSWVGSGSSFEPGDGSGWIDLSKLKPGHNPFRGRLIS